MRAAVARGGRIFEVEERAAPEPEAGQALVRLEACGLCGSDLHFYHAGLMAPGHTPGHEMVGRIAALPPGSSDTRLAVGARVAVEPLKSCGSCADCRAGRTNRCPELLLLGVQLPGGFCEEIAVGVERLYPVDEALPAPVAALVEPVAVALHGLDRGGFEAGQRVLVLGAGAIGLLAAHAAVQRGAGEVCISARHPHQASEALRLGAHRVLREEEAEVSALQRLAPAERFDLVIESVGGAANTLQAASWAVAPGGAISVLGVFMGAVSLDAIPMLMREGSVSWSNCYRQQGDEGADFARAARLVEAERERLAPLVTHEQPLEEIDQAFRIASDKSSGVLKLSVRMGGAAVA